MTLSIERFDALDDSRGNSNDGSPTRGNSNDNSPTRTEVRSPTSTSTSTEVRSPTSTSTDAYTRGNITVTGGAGAGANTRVNVYQGAPPSSAERAGRAAGLTQERIVRDSARALVASRPRGTPAPLQGFAPYASTDHASQYPVVPSAPCCGQPVPDREPIPPADMLMGMVVTYPQAMDPELRGFGGTQVNNDTLRGTQVNNDTLRGLAARLSATPGLSSGLREALGGCGCGGPRRDFYGLGDFTTAVVNEAAETARAWAASAGITVSLPPSPIDVIAAVYRLAETERELEVLRQKLRRLRTAGLMRPADLAAYNTAAAIYYNAAKAVYTPVIGVIRTASPSGAALIPPISRPPGIDAPDRPLPWVPSEADLERLRRGDTSGGGPSFNDAVSYVRSRLAGGGTRGLGILGVDDLTIGGLICITIGVVAIAAVVIALVVPVYALTQVLQAWIATRAAADVATRRKEVYDTCVAGGTSTTECARQAQALVPMPDIPPSGFGLELGVGGLAIGAVAIGGLWYAFGGGKAKVRAAFAGYTPAYGPRRPKKRGRTLRW